VSRRSARRPTVAPITAATRGRVQPSSAVAPAVAHRVRVLGLDPGSRATGYAFIECAGAESAYLASGAIRSTSESFPMRLQEIFAGIASLVDRFRPDEVAIERVFMHRNADSAIKLGQARGAALCGTFATPARIYEYAPREIKLAVTGTGAAQKEQVQLMVKRLLKLSGTLGADAADALAVALCHAHSRRLAGLIAASDTARPGRSR